jgi:FkbM family methyltransferase
MNREIDKVLTALNIQPVLVDIGASGAPPKIWEPIARHSVYLGFDPDQRELHDVPDGEFARSIIVNEAVTSASDQNQIHFYLTHSPYCSSTLPPDTESLVNYLFSDLFMVEREASVPASTLSTVLDRLSLQSVDWFKTDSQGTDLRLFQSLRDDLREHVLAVDIEPGLIDAYIGEDLFVDAHRELLRQGFWLSSLEVKGTVRMKRTTLQAVASHRPELQDTHIYQSVRPSPGWCEARYLRTLKSLAERNAEARDYALLWVFAMIERQWGYALDIACVYEQQFAKDSISLLLRDLPLQLIVQKNRNVRSIAKRFLQRLRYNPYCRAASRLLGCRKITTDYEPQVCEAIRRLVKPGWICADVGANIGMITSVLAEADGPEGRVIAFEAFPDNTRVLRQRMDGLGLGKRVVVENVAVTDGSTSRVCLNAGRHRSSAEWNIMGHDVDGHPMPPEMEVDAISLDQCFKPGQPLHFVKMDIEGAAVLALAGMRRLLREQHPVMLIEFHDEPEWAARQHLLDAGYALFELEGQRVEAPREARRRYQCIALCEQPS